MPDQSVSMGWRRYRFEVRGKLVALSALHIGSGEQLSIESDAPLLRGRDRIPYIPGSSIRGVCNHELRSEAGLLGCTADQHSRLFGAAPGEDDEQSAENTFFGRVVFENAYAPDERQDSEIRDHVHIDERTGAAADGAKFDSQVLLPGAVFQFRASYEGDGANDPECALFLEALRRLKEKEIRLGAKSGWGYGLVRLDEIEHRRYDRSQEQDLAAWFAARIGDQQEEKWIAGLPEGNLKDPGDGEADAFSILDFDLRLLFDGPVLIKSALPPFPPEQPAAPDPNNLDALNQAGRHEADAVFITTGNGDREKLYLPGSSFRGVLHSHGFRIAETTGNQRLTKLLFGSIEGTKRRGLIQVMDGELEGKPRYLFLDHVAIDRIVSGGADGKKFSTSALESPVFRIRVHLRFRQADYGALALWGRILRDLMEDYGRIWVGSGTSRGYGRLRRAEVVEATLNIVDSAEQVFPWQPAETRPGRTMYRLKPAFADLAPLWALAGNAWVKGAQA